MPVDLICQYTPGLGSGRIQAVLMRLSDGYTWNPNKVGGAGWEATVSYANAKIALSEATGGGSAPFQGPAAGGLYYARLQYAAPGFGTPHDVLVRYYDDTAPTVVLPSLIEQIVVRKNERVWNPIPYRHLLADDRTLEEHLLFDTGALLAVMTAEGVLENQRKLFTLSGDLIGTSTMSTTAAGERTAISVTYAFPAGW